MYFHSRKAILSLILTVSTCHAAIAIDGVSGTVVRPRLANAKVKGCQISEPGEYTVDEESLIELEYQYPIVPGAAPTKVDFKQTLIGAIGPSKLGIRHIIAPSVLGVGKIGFYFDARAVGKDTVTLIIDNDEYKFVFTVKKPVAK